MSKLAATLLAAIPLTAAAADTAATLPQLMQLLAQRGAAQATFEETQYLAIATQPLRSAGTLIYRPPGHLEQRITTPRREDLILDQDLLTLQLGHHHQRTVPLAQYPQLAPLLQSLRATLAGDGASLQQLFAVQLQGPLSHWQLALTPHTAALADAISRIELHGSGAQLEQILIQQTDGDHAVLQIHAQP